MKKVERDVADLVKRLRTAWSDSQTKDRPDGLLLYLEASDALSELLRKNERRNKQLRRRQSEENVIVGDLQGWYERAIAAESKLAELQEKNDEVDS